MLCPRAVHGAACALVLLALATTACRGNERASGNPTLVQPTPDRTVDAVVRGLATLAPLVDPTATPEPHGLIASSVVVADGDGTTHPAAAGDTASASAAEPANEFEAVAAVSSEATDPVAEAQPSEDVEPSVAVKPQRGESRKVRPTSTPESGAQLQAASAEEPQSATTAHESEAEPAQQARKKKRN